MRVLVYPLLEEACFRGLLQGWLLQRAWSRRQRLGVSAANLLVSLLFALSHLWALAPAWALAILLPSLVFGHFRERYRSILPSFLLHAWYNLGWLLIVCDPAPTA